MSQIMENDRFSFKILIHDVQIQSKEQQTLNNPVVSVCFAGFPRLVIKGTCPISSNQTEKKKQEKKSFANGKSALIKMPTDQLLKTLGSEPLEILLLNEEKMFAGARLTLKAFIADINEIKFSGNQNFRRGQFHMHNQLGQAYALIDLSMSLTQQYAIEVSNHEGSNQDQSNIDDGQKIKYVSEVPSQEQSKQDSLQDFDDPIPDQIKFKPKSAPFLKQTKDLKPQNKQEFILVEDNHSHPKVNQEQVPFQHLLKNVKQPSQKEGLVNQKELPVIQKGQPAKQKPPLQKYPPSSKQTHQQKQSRNTQEKPNTTTGQNEKEDISIMDWVTGYHCPPPLVFDNKILYHDVLLEQKDPINQINKTDRSTKGLLIYPQKLSIGVQTESDGMFQILNAEVRNQSKSLISPDESRKKTGQSEEYPEDFESIAQSQQIQNSIRKSSQQYQSQISPMANNTSLRKQKAYGQNEVDEVDEQLSEIYSEDFEAMSQSASLKRSFSQEKINSRSYRKISNQPEEISESYMYDFESVSQFTNSTSKAQKKK